MVKSDIEIARSAKMKPIREVLDKVNVPDNPEAFSPMGRHIAKLNLEYIENQSLNLQHCDTHHVQVRAGAAAAGAA